MSPAHSACWGASTLAKTIRAEQRPHFNLLQIFPHPCQPFHQKEFQTCPYKIILSLCTHQQAGDLSLLPQGSRNPWLLSNLKGPGQVLFSKQNCTGRIQPVQLLNGWQEAPCLEHAVSPLVSNTFGPINILSPRQSKSRRLGNQSRIIFPGTGNPAATTPMDSGTADWQEERD